MSNKKNTKDSKPEPKQEVKQSSKTDTSKNTKQVDTKPTKQAEPAKNTKSEPKQEATKSSLTLLTQKANLNFNVNSFKTWLKKYYQQNEMNLPKVQKKDAENKSEEQTGDMNTITFKGAHVALAAAVEVLCKYILEETVKQLQKDTSGLYSVSRPAIKYAVSLNPELRHVFLRSLESFKQDMMYVDQFCIPHKEMCRYVDNVFGKNIQIDHKAYNILSYLLLSFAMEVAKHSFNMMLYSGKRSLDFSVINYTVKNLCSGSLEHDITLKIEDAMKLCNEKDDEEENPKGTSDKKKTDSKEDEQEDEQEEEQNDESEHEQESEQEEEPEEEEPKVEVKSTKSKQVVVKKSPTKN